MTKLEQNSSCYYLYSELYDNFIKSQESRLFGHLQSLLWTNQPVWDAAEKWIENAET